MKKFLLFLLAGMLVASCKIENIPYPDNSVNFETSELGIDGDETRATLTLTLDYAQQTDVTVCISLQGLGVGYGTQYTTQPEADNNTINLCIPAGQTGGTVTVTKIGETFFDGNESIAFKLASVNAPCVIGTKHAGLTLKFSPLQSQGGSLELNGGEGGSNAANSVFVDLSANRQTTVLRKSWDFGFYCKDDDFRAIINYASLAAAKKLDKNDLATVAAADTLGLGSTLVISMNASMGMEIVDDPEGDLTKTAIASVSEVDANNKVYIINPGSESGTPPRDWMKIRVLRKNNGYTLQYAKIADATYKTIDIPKDAAYSFKFVSCEANSIVSVEPEGAKWDIVWTRGVYPFFYMGSNIPMPYSDLVFVNTTGGTKAVEILTSSITYEAFSSANVNDALFANSNRISIGSGWRSTGGPSGGAGVKSDRFYVVKDPSGSVYKLRFTSLTGNGNKRGYPNIQYALLQ